MFNKTSINESTMEPFGISLTNEHTLQHRKLIREKATRLVDLKSVI